MFEWLHVIEPKRTIGEIQFWGDGKWGAAHIGDDVLTLNFFRPENPDRALLLRLTSRFRPNEKTIFGFELAKLLVQIEVATSRITGRSL